MPTFNFEGRNPEGKLMIGKRLSQSADTLSAQLLKERITPIRITPINAETDYLDAIKGFFSGGKVSLEELGLFSRQMHALVKTGVPITAALRQLAENARSARMANALYGIVEKLEGGQDLVTAMSAYPKIFTPIMISMVRVGQSSGRLDEAFLRLNQYLELEASGMKRVKAALRYPAVVFVSVICAIIFINILVIPTFSKIFTQANLELPTATRIMIAISQFFVEQWPYLLVALAIIVGSLIYYFRTPRGKYNWYRYQFKIPGFGDVLRRTVLLRFSQAFAITIESGIPLLEGLTLVAHTINNTYAEQEILDMCESIRHGNNLTQSAAGSKLFTPLELQMLSVSEETGELSQMLNEVANYYRREVDYDLKRLNDMIEPMLIVLLAIVVLILAFSVYLPIWDMVKMAHHG